MWSTRRLLAGLALVLAVLSLVVGGPLVAVAVIFLAVAVAL